MNQAIKELYQLAYNDPHLSDEIEKWLRKWVVDLHSTSMITYEALKHAKTTEDIKEYYKKLSYRQFGEAAAPFIAYEEEFISPPYSSERTTLETFHDLSAPLDLRMRFDMVIISDKPKDKI